MVDRKIEKIARKQSRGEDGKAGVSAWRTGKSRQIEATVSNQRGGGSKRGVQDSSGITSSIYLRWFRAGRVRGRVLVVVKVVRIVEA